MAFDVTVTNTGETVTVGGIEFEGDGGETVVDSDTLRLMAKLGLLGDAKRLQFNYDVSEEE